MKTIAQGFVTICLAVAAIAVSPSLASAGTEAGECNQGFCGTPSNDGGGCGCGCGCSILVANTDIGQTYSTSDDYDGDGYEDNFDNCPFVANRDQTDTDKDGIGDRCDNCPSVANADQSDIDGDTLGDACDPDKDNDRVLNASDNCATVPNPNQADSNHDGIGDLCDPSYLATATTADSDQDGVPDSIDNCPGIPNGTAQDNQKDTDNDGIGDACDPDIDNDGVLNAADNCPAVANPPTGGKLQHDGDHDGYGDNFDANGNGASLCDPDGYCFVAANNIQSHCLDPQSTFTVTATPRVNADVGKPVYLTMLANRENVAIKYSWSVTSAPKGISATVAHPVGATSTSSSFEYTYSGTRPTFTPPEAGTYTITLSANLVNDDPLFPGVVAAQNEVTVQAAGKKTGCSQTEGAEAAALAAFALIGFGILRRKRD